MRIKVVRSDLICLQCGTVNTIERKESLKKKLYHLKRLYCPVCRKVLNQVEVRDADLFVKRLEFKPHLTSQEKTILRVLKK